MERHTPHNRPSHRGARKDWLPNQPMWRCTAVLMFLLQPSGWLVGQGAGPDQPAVEVTGWIDDLASDSFQTRQEASDRLAASGEQVLEPMRARLKETQDVEQRARLQALVRRVEDQVLGDRMEAFIRDPDPDQDHGLKAWPAFRRLMGSNRLSKQILVEIYRQQPKLADATLEGQDALEREVKVAAERMRQTWLSGENVELGDGLALLFAGAVTQQPLGPEIESLTMRCVQTVPLAAKIDQRQWTKPMKNLLAAWVDRLSRQSAGNGMMLVLTRNIQAGEDAARRILSEKVNDPYDFRIACMILAKYGSVDDLTLLDKWLDDTTLYQEYVALRAPFDPRAEPNAQMPPGGNVPIERVECRCEYRDIALAASLVIAKVTLRDYHPMLAPDSRWVIQEDSMGFPIANPQLRQETIDRWKAYRKEGK
jgi:hypothetical protein